MEGGKKKSTRTIPILAALTPNISTHSPVGFPNYAFGAWRVWICREQRLQHITQVPDRVPLHQKQATPAAPHSSPLLPTTTPVQPGLRDSALGCWQGDRKGFSMRAQPLARTFSRACPSPSHPSSSHPDSCKQEQGRISTAEHSRRPELLRLHWA